MFLDPTLEFTSATTQRYEYVEASDAETMQAKFAARIAAIVNENVARVDADLLPFNVYEVDISGGGDGHTFIVKMLLSDSVSEDPAPTTYWPAGLLPGAQAQFWLASTEDALQAAAPAALAAIVAPSATILIATGQAGAAKGTRFMAFVAGILEAV